MSAPVPEPDDPSPIEPVTDPPLDAPGDNPLERDSSKEGPWTPGDPYENPSPS
jgi:hypothetical protein